MTLAGGSRVFDARRRWMAAITIVALLAFQWLGGGLSADVSLPMTACLAALLLWQGVRRGGGAALAQTPLLIAVELMFAGTILVLIGSVLPGVASSLDPSASTVEIILLLGLACAFTLGMMAGASDQVALFAVKLLVVGGAIFAAWALLDFSPLGNLGGRATRLSASYLAPNTAGAVFAALIVLAVHVLFRRLRAATMGENGLRSGLWSAPVVILGAALLATASRGAGLACLVGLGVTLAPQIHRAGKDKGARRALALIAAVLLVLVAALGGALLARLSADQAPANVRGELAAMHWKLFLANPVRGYGLGTFDLVNRANLTPSTFGALWSIRAAHNLYLQWLEEAGWIAAALMGGCLAIVLGATARGAAARRAGGGLLWGLLGVDTVFLIHGCSDFALQTPSVAVLWSFLLGLQFALARQSPAEGPAAFRRAPLQGGLATGVGIVAIAAWLALQCGGALRIGPAEILPLAAGFDRRASHLVETSSSPAALDAAEIASARALSLAPYDTSAALRLAYIDLRRNGRLTAAGEDRLRKSYDRVPLDQGVALWRIRFALESWSEVKPATRALVRREFEALLSTGRHRRALLNMLAEVRSPAGKMIARFWVSRVSSTN
jgi:O-antigen ligase